MAVTFELLEEFTGTRTNEMPDPENEGQVIETADSNVRDILVRFTCETSGCTHERSVNVVFDSEGNYDHDATLVRCEEVALGVANKMACGVIQQTSEEE